MPKIKVITSALVVAIGLALFGCSPATPTLTKPRPIILTVLHTNDTAGFTEPCG